MPAGRPTKYKPATVNKILEALRDGCTKTAAAACGGITFTTLNEWEKEFPEFSEAVAQAEGEAEAIATRAITRAMPDDWRAAESWLKRRRKDDWSEKVTTEHAGGIEFIDGAAATLDQKLLGAAAAVQETGVPGEPDAG